MFSTVAVKVGMPFHTSVSASKGAIEGFARSLAAEYAPGLRVNVVAPSLTDTPMAERFLNNVQNLRRLKPGQLDRLNVEVRKSKIKRNLRKGIF